MTSKELDEKLQALFKKRETCKQSEHEGVNITISDLINDPSHVVLVDELIGQGRCYLVKWLKVPIQIKIVFDIHREKLLDYYDNSPENKSRFYRFLKTHASEDPRFARHQLALESTVDTTSYAWQSKYGTPLGLL